MDITHSLKLLLFSLSLSTKKEENEEECVLSVLCDEVFPITNGYVQSVPIQVIGNSLSFTTNQQGETKQREPYTL